MTYYSQTLTIEVAFVGDPFEPPRIGVLWRDGATLRGARQIVFPEPVSEQGIANAVRALVRAWLAPELERDADEVLHALLTSLGNEYVLT